MTVRIEHGSDGKEHACQVFGPNGYGAAVAYSKTVAITRAVQRYRIDRDTRLDRLYTFRMRFTGRKAGAIGITYPICATVRANSRESALQKLYTIYEHIMFCEASKIQRPGLL